MEAEYDISNNLLETPEQIPIKKSNSCCTNFFCCLCLWFKTKNTDKKKYINKWREYLNRESVNDITCFRTITNLWAHKNVILDLEKIRLNPNLISSIFIRNDLEFYIPQLCTFLIFGDYEKCEELLAFLCKACYASYFFAHRILWFLRSMLKIKAFEQHFDKIYQRIILIESIYKSEKDINKLDKINVAYSSGYIDFIKKRNFEFLYNYEKINWKEINKSQTNMFLYDQMSRLFFKNFELSENLKKDFILKHMEFFDDLKKEETNNNKPFEYGFKINPEDVFIRIFKNNEDNSTNTEYKQTLALFQDSVPSNVVAIYNENRSVEKEVNIEEKIKKSESYKNDINLKAFLSTMNFIDSLCNICKDAVAIPIEEQIIFIKREISHLNKELPGNVYMPFLNNGIRNHIIVHMPISELKIFRTKTRVLYMTTVEIVRMDEITNQIEILENKKVKNISNNFEYSLNTMDDGSNRGRSYSMATSYNDYLDKMKSNQKKIKQKEKEKMNSLVSLLDENDINLSKAITIDNIMQEDKKQSSTKSKYNNKSKLILEQEEEEEVNFKNQINFKGNEIDNMIKRRITQSSKIQNRFSCTQNSTRKNKLSSKTFLSGECPIPEANESGDKILEKDNFENKNICETKKSFFKEDFGNNIIKEIESKQLIKQEDLIKEKDSNIFNCVETDYRNRSESFYCEAGNNRDLLNEEDKNIEVIKFKKSQSNVVLKKENNENQVIFYVPPNQDVVFIDYKKVFGEVLEEQAERIKRTSPFGNFKTWKICKIIVKSGEDLIQEQFATQLINEFYQIFQLEKVNCWVYPYEILSTGNESGIIEVVNNAISIDDLKKKIKNKSLREFFLNYFGPADSKEFKAAMNNFIQSLAGYSLLCYFLQIKDRHNANILIDSKGHIVHIDFGFLLSNAPGKGIKFEKAPFKLTDEFVECMGGVNSSIFRKFRQLLWSGFIALVKHSQRIIILVEMMYAGFGDTLGCFTNKENTISDLKNRFFPYKNMETKHYFKHVDSLIEESIDNWRTRWYDKFQYVAQGILY